MCLRSSGTNRFPTWLITVRPFCTCYSGSYWSREPIINLRQRQGQIGRSCSFLWRRATAITPRGPATFTNKNLGSCQTAVPSTDPSAVTRTARLCLKHLAAAQTQIQPQILEEASFQPGNLQKPSWVLLHGALLQETSLGPWKLQMSPSMVTPDHPVHGWSGPHCSSLQFGPGEPPLPHPL
jgi:hypothetical protein